MILADTSAWIEYLRGTGSPAHLALRTAVIGDEVATTDVVVLELLSGSRPERAESEQRMLQTVGFLPQHPRDDAVHAAELFRFCRSRGVTIRSLNDCVVAAVAIRNDVPVLHADADFDHLARLTRLQVVSA
jgi:predicted nucleic acid-binding protein